MSIKNKKTNHHKLHLSMLGLFLVMIAYSVALTRAQSTEENSFDVFANSDGRTSVAGVNIQATNLSGTVVARCTTPESGPCQFSHTDLAEEVYFVGKKDGIIYGGLLNPNYGCKAVTVKSEDGAVYQYIDSQKVEGDALRNYAVFTKSFYSTTCKYSRGTSSGASTSESSESTEETPSQSNPPARRSSTSRTVIPNDLSEEDDEDEEFVEDEEEDFSEVDVALKNVTKITYGKKGKKKGFNMTIATENDSANIQKGVFSITCSTRPSSDEMVSLQFQTRTKTVNIKPGKSKITFFYPVGVVNSNEVRTLEADRLRGGYIECYMALPEVFEQEDGTDVSDSDPSNNDASMTARWKNKSNLRVESFGPAVAQ